MKRHHRLWLLQALCLLTLILFSAPIEAQSADEIIRQQLEAEGIAVTDVTVSPQEVFVAYEEDLLLGEDSQLVNWLLIMQSALETVPQAERVVIHMDILGEPRMEVTGTMANVRSLLSEEMDPTAFFDSLVIDDRRPPDRALVEDMVLFGVLYPDLKVDGSELHIHFFQPETESGDELVDGWVQILLLVADKTGGLTRTHLHSTFPDGMIVDVSADMADVLAYRAGDLSALELFDRLKFVGLPEVVATPTPALGLIAPTPTLVPGRAETGLIGPGAAELSLGEPGSVEPVEPVPLAPIPTLPPLAEPVSPDELETAIAVLETATAMAQSVSTPMAGAAEVWTRPADGMEMVYVPAGEFRMGSTDDQIDQAWEMCKEFEPDCEREWFENEQPLHTVALDGFWLDRTEVTNEQYRACVEAGVCDPS